MHDRIHNSSVTAPTGSSYSVSTYILRSRVPTDKSIRTPPQLVAQVQTNLPYTPYAGIGFVTSIP